MHTGWTIEYIEELPITVLNEYKALNALSPYIGLNERLLSFIGAAVFNSTAKKKKDLRSESQLFPWLRKHDRYEDDLVLKAKHLINSVRSLSAFNSEFSEASLKEVRSKIVEEIFIQRKNITTSTAKTVRYRIRELQKLL